MIFNKIKNYRFPIWITVFLFLLGSIPVFIYAELYSLAKIFGILLVCSILLAMKFWFAVARNRNDVVPRVVLNRNDLFDLDRDFKSFSSFNEESKRIIIHRIGLLLAKVKFVDDNLSLLDRRMSIQLAFVYVCENASVDFEVSRDWIFLLSDSANTKESFEFVISKENLSKKFIQIDQPII